MTATADATASVATPDEVPRPARWPAWALAAICALAGALYAWNIADGHVGNAYYAAAAKSMLTSFPDFLFGSFDPAGVQTIDKPPMAVWPQAIAVALFGMNGWAVLLPQVIEGVAAVFLLHRTVRLWADEKVALLAALILTLTPITVAINHNNNPDTLLVLLLVASAYAFTRSVRAPTGRTRTTWLAWCAFFIGCGFLAKMLQAWIIVPGFALAYLAGTTGPLKRRVLDLLAAGAVLVVSSFWWVALHAWWPGAKPYVSGSADGSAWNLTFGYNGLGRIFDGNGAGGPPFGGRPGITRMVGTALGGQISWLIPFCLLVLVVVAGTGLVHLRRGIPGDAAKRAGWIMWGSWLLVTAAVFSSAKGTFHAYYTTMLAPAIAAIGAAGLMMFWRSTGFARFLLPLGVAITAVWAFVVSSHTPNWFGWTRWTVAGIAAVAVIGLLTERASIRRPALAAALVAALLTPAVWAVDIAHQPVGFGISPTAGPKDPGAKPPPPAPVPPGKPAPPPSVLLTLLAWGTGYQGKLTAEQQRLLAYAEQHSGGAQITLAVAAPASVTAPFIIDSDEVVIGMGGFSGVGNAPSPDQLQHWVSEGRLKFVLGISGGSPGDRSGRQQWIKQHCSSVDPKVYGGGGSAHTLYECRA